MQKPIRKQVKHFHEPGDIHELTFSCYQRRPLLTNNVWRARLSRCIDDACANLGCCLAAFVYMPEHVHLLVWGLRAKEEVSTLLLQIKKHTPVNPCNFASATPPLDSGSAIACMMPSASQ